MTEAFQRLALPVTLPASWLYAAGVAARNRRFDRPDALVRLDRPVISIGNITVGGTGKTPMVAWIARTLLAQGHRPVIAMRGYGAKINRESDDGGDAMSDEEAEYRELVPDIRIIADPNRAAALKRFLSHTDPDDIDCILLDDGFQHRRVARDLDIVLVDATQNTMNDRVLPAGRLREPLANLRRADAVIVTRASRVDQELARAIERHHGRPPIAWCDHIWTELDVPAPHVNRHPVSWLQGKRIVTMLGVGNPAAVERQVEAAGATIVDRIPVRDHQHYDHRFLADIARRIAFDRDALLVTQKDWVKLRTLIDSSKDSSAGSSGGSGAWPIPIIVPVLEIRFHAGQNELEQALSRTLSTATGQP